MNDKELESIIIIQDEISKLNSRESLKKVDKLIANRMSTFTRKEIDKYEIGQTVRFEAELGQFIQGRITRINLKTVSIKTPQGNWRVSPSYISGVV